jgi:hypothetical protein
MAHATSLAAARAALLRSTSSRLTASASQRPLSSSPRPSMEAFSDKLGEIVTS